MKDSKVFGDQYAVVEIQVPTTLTPQAARKLREFEAECAKTSGTSKRNTCSIIACKRFFKID